MALVSRRKIIKIFISKRNFILLIITLFLTLIIFFGFLYFSTDKNPAPGDTEGTNFLSQFNPFGSGGTKPTNTTPPPVDVSGYQPDPISDITTKLKKVSSMPVAGFTVYLKERLKEVLVVTNPTPALPLSGEGATPAPPAKEGSGGLKVAPKPTPPATEFAPALRYVDRTTGNIYQTFADKIEERRFSTTVIPKIYEALFGSRGESVVLRYLEEDGVTIATFVGRLPKEILAGDTTEDNELKGFFLPEGIKDVSMSMDGSSLFYLFNVGETAVGATLNFSTNKKTQIFTSPFTEWLSSFPNSKTITLTTKPASGVPGYMYTVNGNSKSLMTQALGNINGLTTLASPSGRFILYADSSLSLSAERSDTKTYNPVGVKTLPEKCVWGSVSDVVYCSVPKSIPAGEYPDSWYQGEVSFSDQIWKVDITTGNATMVADLSSMQGGEDIDGIKLALDKDETYLFFVNKKDSFLWELQLK